MRRIDVEQFPKELDSDVLYVSEEIEMTLHACACGCGHRVYTFLGDGHTVSGSKEAPTIYPSIGVWDACKSHYWIRAGNIIWAEEWTDEMISSSMVKQSQRHLGTKTKGSWSDWLQRAARLFGALKAKLKAMLASVTGRK
jgi:hypothetical protein